MSERQYGHDGRHHGRGTPDCPTELHHHHDERCVSPLEDRRQRAREAFYDRAVLPEGEDGHAIEAAIETALRVQVTMEVREAGMVASGYGLDISYDTYERIIVAAFEAAGFEVEQ